MDLPVIFLLIDTGFYRHESFHHFPMMCPVPYQCLISILIYVRSDHLLYTPKPWTITILTIQCVDATKKDKKGQGFTVSLGIYIYIWRWDMSQATQSLPRSTNQNYSIVTRETPPQTSCDILWHPGVGAVLQGWHCWWRDIHNLHLVHCLSIRSLGNLK